MESINVDGTFFHDGLLVQQIRLDSLRLSMRRMRLGGHLSFLLDGSRSNDRNCHLASFIQEIGRRIHDRRTMIVDAVLSHTRVRELKTYLETRDETYL
jgi:hypothetical protein